MDARTTEFAVADAKARFSELLARAEAGEEIVIRRHGRIVAKLVPAMAAAAPTMQERRAAHEEWLRWRASEGPRLAPGESVTDLIAEGRKY
ncbi:type II toxin-antitoxin system prevent-host-death family antitoxin [Sphingomonas naphthae]|uniref:Antitoxin n=1 Tax=Sphingomonas naphthae TaxID=1813468 RepID=A0ABY7TP68_9SPHN|nr:type II toxin-antitoxin system prevent-host-death family antitoxin [Sphingomonas naphthae]WCT74781.1 type II toxin-antitoxin system prevent-host-death family antitoxin [Sphingomonas naphthae]